MIYSPVADRGTASQPQVCRGSCHVHRHVAQQRPRVWATRYQALKNDVPVADTSQVGSVAPQLRLQHGAAAVQGPRESMEDFLTVQEAQEGLLFAGVYDGHNGDSAAKYLVQHLFHILQGLLAEQGASSAADVPATKLQAVVADSFRKTDEKLLSWMREYARGEDANSGSCATTALVRGDTLVVANVGDSRAVLCREGQAVVLTAQHRVHGRGAAVKEETRRVQEVGGWVDDGRVCGVLAVSRAFGDPEFKGPGLEHLLRRGVSVGMWSKDFAGSRRFTGDPVIVDPDVTTLALSAKDEFLVLATDGLWDVMDSQDVTSLARTNLRKGQSAQEVADKLAQIALKRYTADNVAVLVISFQHSGPGAAGAQAGKASSGGGKPAKKGGLFGLFR